ncbi:hypothetical protein ACEPUD_28220 [Burkholderia ubonensis]|uniref:hypothetical protein n=1 Tax=Burkholderia ubonensis TaxID=101571 RepID=UPI00358E3F4B
MTTIPVTIFEFDAVYPERAAQEQADKKKLNAFGMFARFNPLKHPKDDTVLAGQSVLRYEPFWKVEAIRTVDYTCQVNYPITILNPYARQVSLSDCDFDVIDSAEKRKIEIPAIEHCIRSLKVGAFRDALERDIPGSTLSAYLAKYAHHEVVAMDNPEALRPKLTIVSVVQETLAQLQGQAINATEIVNDETVFYALCLYYRPVYAFEFIWSAGDRRGVIEVNGLTGETDENGEWFREKLDRVLTKEMLIEAASELAGALVPGGGFVVKAISRIAS